MGKISINGLRITAHHGVLAQERRVGNEFEVNIVIDVPDSYTAMVNDSLDDTINYAEVVELVKIEMSKPSKLIENVAWRIKEAIVTKYGERVRSGSVTVAKLAPPISAQLTSVAYTTDF